jgi:type I restriction enzyme M protein
MEGDRAACREDGREEQRVRGETHRQLASFIWSICNLLRGPYKRNEYRKVILPLTVLRRFDCLLAPTKAAVLEQHAAIQAQPEMMVRRPA